MGKRLPVVCSREEVRKLLRRTDGVEGLVIRLLRLHLLEAGQYIRAVQELPGHSDVKTTMIYSQVLNKGPLGAVSPLDTR